MTRGEIATAIRASAEIAETMRELHTDLRAGATYRIVTNVFALVAVAICYVVAPAWWVWLLLALNSGLLADAIRARRQASRDLAVLEPARMRILR